jgi:predicted dehydrogenase
MRRAFRTVLIGCGRVGCGYADDPVMAAYFRFASHAQVLACHPRFDWQAVVDSDERRARAVAARFGVPHFASRPGALPDVAGIEVAVLATPPGGRERLVAALPGLRALLVEKPLGVSEREAERFADRCVERGLSVQVNLLRRADRVLRRLAAGVLHRRIGRIQAAFGVYGNGLLNNGVHMVDLIRMLVGEVAWAAPAAARAPGRPAGPIPGDMDVPFLLGLEPPGPVVVMHPLGFRHYRENALDLWGERGRLSIVQEGLVLLEHHVRSNRATQGEREVASDRPAAVSSGLPRALHDMYSNLATHLDGAATLLSPLPSALASERLVHRVLARARVQARPRRPGGGHRRRGGAL